MAHSISTGFNWPSSFSTFMPMTANWRMSGSDKHKRVESKSLNVSSSVDFLPDFKITFDFFWPIIFWWMDNWVFWQAPRHWMERGRWIVIQSGSQVAFTTLLKITQLIIKCQSMRNVSSVTSILLPHYLVQFMYLSKSIICRDEYLKWISGEWIGREKNSGGWCVNHFLDDDPHSCNSWLTVISIFFKEFIHTMKIINSKSTWSHLQTIWNRLKCERWRPTLHDFLWNGCLLQVKKWCVLSSAGQVGPILQNAWRPHSKP